MELRQLGYFAAVARHRHFTRAADELHVTQSALSQGVRRLEDELGVALLRRDGRGVELTAAGEDLLARARTMLAEAARARAEMDAHAGLLRGIVRVAATAGDAPGLPPALAAFHADHPGIRIGLRQGTTAEVLELIRTGAVDLAIASMPQDAGAGVRATPLGDEPLVAIAAPEDPLGSAGEVTPWDLRDRPFILAEPGSGLRAAVAAACAAAGFSPVPLFEVGEPAAVRYLAHAGLGVSIVPASWLRAPFPPAPAVAVARLAAADGDELPRHRVALLRATAGAAPAAELLHAHLRGVLGGANGGHEAA